VLLFPLDWASLTSFARHGVSALNLAGFVLVNAVLLVLTAYAWRWLRASRSRPLR
jgi:hypothetical protein